MRWFREEEMAVVLPTFTIQDDAKANRILTAFHNDATEYRDWLKQALLQEVTRRESTVLQQQIQQLRQELSEFLG
jgi:hypothetical protein